MEKKENPPRDDMIIPVTALGPLDNPKPCHKLRKKRGPMYFIKVALFMIKNNSDQPKRFSETKSNGILSKLVGSVRPLHLHLEDSSEVEATMTVKAGKSPALSLPNSPSPARSEFSEASLLSPSSSSSRYASALGLNEMVVQGEEEDTEAEVSASEDWDGDDKIDAKAEEFIANFYNEMKLQRRHSINERSLR